MKKNITQTVQTLLAEAKAVAVKLLTATTAQIRIPTQRPTVQTAGPKKRQTEHVTKEWSPEVSHTDHLSTHFSMDSKTSSYLVRNRIQPLHIKKMIALLKKLSQHPDNRRTKVSGKVLHVEESKKEQKNRQAQDELWRDMMKPQEERHYQIDRITNYFR